MAHSNTSGRVPEDGVKSGSKYHTNSFRKWPQDICGPLTKEVIETFDRSLVETVQEDQACLEKYLKSLTKGAMTGSEISLSLKRPCQFSVIRKKNVTVKQPRNSKRRLSRKDKELRGFGSVHRSSLRFQDFSPLHELWKQYMREYLNIADLTANGFTGSHLDRQWKQVSVQLLKADYQGANMKVVRSMCPSLVGISGIMVFDMKNSFKLLGSDNVLRTVPKKVSVFQFELDAFVFTVFGRDMCIRPVLRGVKKMKKKLIADL